MKINKNKLDYLLLISPGLILFLILILFPIFLTVIYSFFKISFLTNQYDFIGLKNFYKLLNKKEPQEDDTTPYDEFMKYAKTVIVAEHEDGEHLDLQYVEVKYMP